MCFSASASFIAGTALCAIGVVTLKITKSKTEIPFALIPLLFGIQQLTEGVIWLTFSHDLPVLRQVMTYLYSFFSHVLWPVYMPFAVGMMETIRRRRKIIYAFELAGISVGLYLLYFIVGNGVVAEVVSRHIVYESPHFYGIPIMVFYLTSTCVSCFFSSHGFVKLFGVLLLVTFVTGYLVSILALISIWCFFAAVMSLIVYLHLRFRDHGWGEKNIPFHHDVSSANT